MKKIFIFLTALIGVFFGHAILAENVDSFDVKIRINQDASIDVTENIIMNFGRESRHGIFRNIPVLYRDKEGKRFGVQLENVSVDNEKGEVYNFAEIQSGSDMQIKIGDADVFVTGIKRYIISYTVRGAINHFDDHDELYWNVTGDNWSFPINKASAEVNVDGEVGAGGLKYKCYFGKAGSNAECQGNVISANAVKFENNSVLSPKQGMTIVFGFPKNIVSVEEYREYASEETAWFSFGMLWPFAITILVFVIMFGMWLRYGRDKQNTEQNL